MAGIQTEGLLWRPARPAGSPSVASEVVRFTVGRFLLASQGRWQIKHIEEVSLTPQTWSVVIVTRATIVTLFLGRLAIWPANFAWKRWSWTQVRVWEQAESLLCCGKYAFYPMGKIFCSLNRQFFIRRSIVNAQEAFWNSFKTLAPSWDPHWSFLPQWDIDTKGFVSLI